MLENIRVILEKTLKGFIEISGLESWESTDKISREINFQEEIPGRTCAEITQTRGKLLESHLGVGGFPDKKFLQNLWINFGKVTVGIQRETSGKFRST